MEHLDEAFAEFRRLKIAVPAMDGRLITESDTRLKLIDPMLAKVLRWPVVEILTEENVAPGRLDYLLCDTDRHPSVVVEAKQRDIELVTSGKRGQMYNLGGPVFKNCLKIVETQVVPYCQAKRVSVGVITNGTQWVGLLGNRVDGVAIADDRGVAFSSLDDIEAEFELFYRLFSYEGHRTGSLTRLISGAELRGEIRTQVARRLTRLQDIPRARRSETAAAYYADIATVLDQVFQSIHDDIDLLTECFVDTRESHDADQRLLRLATDLIENIRPLKDEDAYRDHVHEQVDRVSSPTPAVDGNDDMSRKGVVVQLLGERSAGKSTFLRRFYLRRLDRSHRDRIIYAHLHLEAQTEVSVKRIGKALAETFEGALFGDEGPTNAELLEVYKTAWARHLRRRPPGADKDAAQLEFTREIERAMAESPLDFAIQLGRFAVSNRRRLPCIVLDDFDNCSVEQTREVFQTVVSFVTNCPSLMTVAMDDTTAWRTADIDLLARQSPITFWLPRPMTRDVIAKRVEFIQRRVKNTQDGSGRRLQTRLGRSGIRWTADSDKTATVLQNVFIWEESEVVNWIGLLANRDTRAVLDISKGLLCSPIIRIEEHLSAAVIGESPSRQKILRALISPEYDKFHPEKTSFVMNVFTFVRADRHNVLLPLRLLAALLAASEHDAAARAEIRGFVDVDHLQDVFESIGVPRDATLAALTEMQHRELLQSYDPSCACGQGDDPRVRINPRGELHLEWAAQEDTYVRMMAETDHILDDKVWGELARLCKERDRALYQDNKESMRRTSQQIASSYFRYLLATAPLVTGDEFEVAAIKIFEDRLGRQWIAPFVPLALVAN